MTATIENVRLLTKRVLPNILLRILRMEAQVLYYAFFAKPPVELKRNEFSYHQKSGVIALLGAFVGAIAIETVVVHLLLERWNNTAAWIATALSLYGILQLIALLRSLPRMPIILDEERQVLTLRYGFFALATLPLADIESIILSRRVVQSDEVLPLSPVGAIGGQNIIIKVFTHLDLHGLYGGQKVCRSVAFFVDQPEVFKAEIERIRSASSPSVA